MPTPTTPSDTNPIVPEYEEVSASWRERAYPLQQLTVRIQGTRRHSVEDLAFQLDQVAERLRSGSLSGHRYDDDCGYAFSLVESPEGPSFFPGAAGFK